MPTAGRASLGPYSSPGAVAIAAFSASAGGPWSCGPGGRAAAGRPTASLPGSRGRSRLGPTSSASRAVSESYERQLLVTATNPGSGRWGTVFGDDQMAAAAVDRVCHHGRLLRLGGESYRAGHAPVSGEVGVDG